MQYIPLIIRVRGPYGKLWTEFFLPSFYFPSAKCVGHENKELEGKKRGSITCCTDLANEDNKMLLYGFVDCSGKRTKSFDVH